MNREDLYESMEDIDDAVLTRSERRRRRPWWIGAAAAAVAVAVAVGLVLRPDGSGQLASAFAIAEADYPEMAPYPDESAYWDDSGTFDDDGFYEAYDAWRASRQALPQTASVDGTFLRESIRQFLSGAGTENRAYSPLNVYLALAMLAELTDGESRAQILALLGAADIETLRAQAGEVWEANYRADGATTCILADSVWLDADIAYVPGTMQTLAADYYASSFQGEMGSDAYNDELRRWLSVQTGGLLDDQIADISLSADTVLALATTLYYQAKWAAAFPEENTAPDTFHAADGDRTCDFMRTSMSGSYYWGDRFSAVGLWLENGGGTMWLLLPDEGVTPEDLLADDEAMAFALADGDWENRQSLLIHLSMPKFDIASQIDLREGLQALGVTDVFDPAVSDFSPATEEVDGIFVSQALHGVRVAADEEGLTAAAYTVMAADGTSGPPDDEIDFVLDRPFVFVLTGSSGLPLLAGIVNTP